MRNTLLAIFLSLIFTSAASAEILVGRFLDLEFGDYAHVTIVDNAGNNHSFWLGNDRSLEKFVTDTDKYRNKNVRVHWHKVNRHIPEAGGDMEIEEVTKIEVLD